MALKIFQEGKVSFSPHHKSNFWMAKIADALSPLSTRSRSRSQARQNMGFLWRCVEESSNHVLALVRWRAAKVHQRNMLMRCARKTQWGRDIKKVSLIYRWIPDTRWYPRDVPISEFLLFLDHNKWHSSLRRIHKINWCPDFRQNKANIVQRPRPPPHPNEIGQFSDHKLTQNDFRYSTCFLFWYTMNMYVLYKRSKTGTYPHLTYQTMMTSALSKISIFDNPK